MRGHERRRLMAGFTRKYFLDTSILLKEETDFIEPQLL